jgi:predicted amino acid racemase
VFLANLLDSNPAFVQSALDLYRKGRIPPNSYVLDIDQIEKNAAMMVAAAQQEGLSLYFMTKQIGRNPAAVRALLSAGMTKAVAVDAAEAMTLLGQGVQLGNVGHLVQIAPYYLERILQAKPEVMTVFSVEAARRISDEAVRLGLQQDILLRVYRPDDYFYNGQEGGFPFEELSRSVEQIRTMPGIRIAGVTSFPNLLVKDGAVQPTKNVRTLQAAAEQLRQSGIAVKQVNIPSVTCVSTLPMLREFGATHGEPGHGLTGTTPLHAESKQAEKTAYLYITEVSHTYGNLSYVYGGGTYNRGRLNQALVGHTVAEAQFADAAEQEFGNIDYYLPLRGRYPIGTPVVMAFRTQMFVTRANVVPLLGVHSSAETIEGIYTSGGQQIAD